MPQAVLVKIYAEWKREKKLWVACSADLRGLETEADTLQALEEKLDQQLPDLLRQQGLEGRAALIVSGA